MTDNQKLAPNMLSVEQTNAVKGGVNPVAIYGFMKTGYDVAKWGYEHRRQIASVAKTTYNVGKKAVNFIKGWF